VRPLDGLVLVVVEPDQGKVIVEHLRRDLASARRELAVRRGGGPSRTSMATILAGATLGTLVGLQCPPILRSQEEIARVRSPAGDLDALVIEGNGGATTAYDYEVVLVKAGRSAFWGAHVTSSYRWRLAPRWKGADSLIIASPDHPPSLRQAHLTVNGRNVRLEVAGGVLPGGRP
jgi:hypothetical protein